MKAARGNSHTRRRGPAPPRAGSSLLVHDLKSLAGRLSNLCHNLNQHYQDPLFKQSAMDLLDDTADHLLKLAGDLRDHEGRLMVKLRTDLNQVLADSLSHARPDLIPGVEVVTKYARLEPIWGEAYLLR